MIAELPMYDLPECRMATNTLWAGIARADLFLSGIKVLPVVEYNEIAKIEVESANSGYQDFDPYVGIYQ